ncbi:MAG: fumarylacetoacetate hydrolase family protein [Casimicrobiaceae bacterium]
MRLVRFNRNVEAPVLARLGVVLASDIVVDLRAGYAFFLQHAGDRCAVEIAAARVPKTIAALVGSACLDGPELRDVVRWLDDRAQTDPAVQGVHGETLFTPLADCRLHAPVRMTNLIVAHDNYGSASGVPTFTMKPSVAVVGPSRDIRMPRGFEQLQCEAGLAVVIGTACRDISEKEVAGAICGYFVMTNVCTSRAGEDPRAFQSLMYESFAPSGPWLTTSEDIPDASDLRIEMTVNGDVRRLFSTASMTWSVERMIAFLSRMSLQPGDVIWTGGLSPGQEEPRVRAGDVVASTVQRVGGIRNRVVPQ